MESRIEPRAVAWLPIENKPLRYLLTTIQPGVFFRSRLPILRAMRDLGWEVHCALPEFQDWITLQAEGIHVHGIRVHRGSTNPFRERETLSDFQRVAREVQPDLAHHFSSKAVIYGSLAGAKLQVSTMTGIGFSLSGSGGIAERLPTKVIAPALYRAAMKKNARVIFQNEDDRDEFIERKLIQAEKTHVIEGSGIDMAEYHPRMRALQPGKIKFVILCRMIKPKGVIEFVEAARLLHARLPNQCEFVLAGPLDRQNPQAISESQLRQWEDEGVARWIGRVDSAIDAYRHAHVAVLPSFYREGLPRSLVEASAMGIPVITTESFGCRNAVQNGVTGFSVPVGDIEELAQKMEILAGNAQLRDRMGAAGRRFVESRFSVETVMNHTLELYERELENSGVTTDLTTARRKRILQTITP